MSATIETVTVYTVVGNTDTTEGRGMPVTLGRSTERHVAHMIAKGRGVMGTDADVEHSAERVVRIDGSTFLVGDQVFHSLVEYEAKQKEDLKSHALSKLTAAERAVLGF